MDGTKKLLVYSLHSVRFVLKIAIVAIVIEIVQKFRFFVHFLIEFRQVLQSSGKYFT